MRRLARFLLRATVCAVILATAALAVGAVAVARGGQVHVEYAELGEGGVDLGFSVPLAGARAAMPFLPREAKAELRRELTPRAPMVSEALRAVSGAPDTTLVQIVGATQRIRIRTQGGDACVDIVTETEAIRVRAPLDSVAKLVEDLGRI